MERGGVPVYRIEGGDSSYRLGGAGQRAAATHPAPQTSVGTSSIPACSEGPQHTLNDLISGRSDENLFNVSEGSYEWQNTGVRVQVDTDIDNHLTALGHTLKSKTWMNLMVSHSHFVHLELFLAEDLRHEVDCGLKRWTLTDNEMLGQLYLREKYSPSKPLAGTKFTDCLDIEVQSVALTEEVSEQSADVMESYGHQDHETANIAARDVPLCAWVPGRRPSQHDPGE